MSYFFFFFIFRPNKMEKTVISWVLIGVNYPWRLSGRYAFLTNLYIARWLISGPRLYEWNQLTLLHILLEMRNSINDWWYFFLIFSFRCWIFARCTRSTTIIYFWDMLETTILRCIFIGIPFTYFRLIYLEMSLLWKTFIESRLTR